MPDDLRNTRRARLSGIRVTIEGATGERRQADVADLSKDGLFIVSETPLAVGKRLSLEIHAVGEPATWPALGRVVWTRETAEGDEKPPGMGIKIIDIEDEAAAAIDRLLETRERTEPGLGNTEKPDPSREKTILGVGMASVPPAAVAPIVVPAPAREATLVGVGGVGAAGAEAREGSVAIDLVTKKPPSATPPEPASAGESRRDAVTEPPKRRRRSGGGLMLLLLVVLTGCAIAAYALRDRLLELWNQTTGTEASSPEPTPPQRPAEAPPPPPTPPPATTMSPAPSASAAPDASVAPAAARSTSQTNAAATSAPSTAGSTPPSGASAKRPAAPQPPPQPIKKPKGPEESNPY